MIQTIVTKIRLRKIQMKDKCLVYSVSNYNIKSPTTDKIKRFFFSENYY